MKWQATTVLMLLVMALASGAQTDPARPAPQNAGKQAEATDDGRHSFESNCAVCHGLDGRGGEHARGIANSSAVTARSNQALFQLIREGISSAGMPSFRFLPDGEVEAVVKYLRYLSVSPGPGAVKGNPARGKKLFFSKARCGECHMMHGKGGFMGSDLTEFGAGHSAKEIRDAILKPPDFGPGQRMVRVTTVAGKEISGVVRNEDNFSMQLQSMDGTFHLLMKSEIVKTESEARPVMPSDYGTTLALAEQEDLVSFIANSAQPAGTAKGRAARGGAGKSKAAKARLDR